MKTLILESKASFTAREIVTMLRHVLGADSYTFHVKDSSENISLHTRRRQASRQESLQVPSPTSPGPSLRTYLAPICLQMPEPYPGLSPPPRTLT